MTTLILFGSFIALLLIGVPIGIALGSASLLAIAYIPFLSFDMYALGLVSGINSFTLIAVVLFTLAGNLMAHGGISRRLIAVADLAFGRAPGDLGTVTIMSCLFFAAISGTGSATVAAIGLAMIPAGLSSAAIRDAMYASWCFQNLSRWMDAFGFPTHTPRLKRLAARAMWMTGYSAVPVG